jgi:hypothetical protein
MMKARPTFPVQVRIGWRDYSPALRWYSAQTLKAALEPYASRIRSVTVHITDHDVDGLDGRTCAIEVAFKPFGSVSASCTGADLQRTVDCATERALAEVQRRIDARAVTEPVSRIA